MERNWKPDVFIFGPGGIKIFIELGFALALEKENLLDSVKIFGGVSAGAIIALLLIVGYTVEEIISECHSFNLFQDFETITFQTIKEHEGILSFERIRQHLSRLVHKKLNFVPSLSRLHELSGKELCTVSVMENSSLSQIQTVYINHRNQIFKDLSCIEAVILSMNIPYLFHKIEYNGFSFSDGGYGDPYPIDQYDDGTNQILGIYVDIEIDSSSGIVAKLFQKLSFVISQIYHLKVKYASSNCKHILIKTKILDLTGLTTTIEDKCSMILEGDRHGKNFINELYSKKPKDVTE